MRISSLLLISSLTACGGSGESTPDAAEVKDIGFNKPAKALKANEEQMPDKWVEIGDADLTCFNTPASDAAISLAGGVVVNTTIRDFQSDNLVPGASISVFNNQDDANPFTTVTADGNADVTFTLPMGTKRFGYKMVDSTSLDTLLLNQVVKPDIATQDVSDIKSVSKSTAQTLPALIGISRTQGTGVLAGAMRDCQDREVSNFIATVSTTSGAVNHVAGPCGDGEQCISDTYYFSSSVGLPVRHTQKAAGSEDGLFMVVELVPTSVVFVQVWGYPTQAEADAQGDLTMIAELKTTVIGDTVITGSYEPLRTP